MAGNFPPDYFAPDYFAPDYFGGEADANAMSAAITAAATVAANLTSGQSNIQAALSGTSSVTATIGTGSVPTDQDYESHWQYAREQKKKRARKKRVVGVLAATIKGRSRVYGILGSTPTLVAPLAVPVEEPWFMVVECRASVRGTATVEAFIEGPDRIEEQDWQDLEDMVDLYMLMAA